ncbi:MAG: hypothetical protein LBJ74_00920 [Heliobacteriaceae bacterium]|jgi:hypothetical protein|nr:hypothetical protein [Heliobacteriaceae bacterium]
MKILNRIINKARNVEVPTPVQRAFSKQELDTVELSAKKSKPAGIIAKIKESLIGLDKATVKSLENMSTPEEFFTEARALILKPTGIPEKFWPGILFREVYKAPKIFGALYDFTSHIAYFPPKILKKSSKCALFSCLRHELTHSEQNISILRTKGLGEEAVKQYAELTAKAQVDNFVQGWKELPESRALEALQNGEFAEDSYNLVMKFKACKDENEIAAFTKESYDSEHKVFLNNWENFRKNIVAEMGEISPDSKEGEFAKQYFAEFMNAAKNAMSGYMTRISEGEAYIKQYAAYFEYLWAKFFKA